MNEKTSDQLTLSLELLRLMQWIIEHDQEGLKRLISRALSHGLNKRIQQLEDVIEDQESVHHSIIDFFILMEALLAESLHEQLSKQTIQSSMIPAVHLIDSTACDSGTVRFSLERATTQMQANPQASPRDLLLKELLKRWKPNKKNMVN